MPTANGNQIAVVKSPLKYDLPILIPLVKNWGCHCWKNQEGEVTVNIMLQAAQNFTTWEAFAVLSEGYRPTILMDYPAVYFSHHAAGVVKIELDGTMRVGAQVTNQNYLYCNVVFLTMP